MREELSQWNETEMGRRDDLKQWENKEIFCLNISKGLVLPVTAGKGLGISLRMRSSKGAGSNSAEQA